MSLPVHAMMCRLGVCLGSGWVAEGGGDELRGGLGIGCREGTGKGCGEVEHGGLEGELVILAESVQNF